MLQEYIFSDIKAMKKKLFFIFLIFPICFIFAQENLSQSQNSLKDKIEYFGETEKYVLVERTDLRRYDNGRYTGLTSREVRHLFHQFQLPKM